MIIKPPHVSKPKLLREKTKHYDIMYNYVFKAFIHLKYFCHSRYSTLIKTFGIWTKGFWIRVDFLYEARWSKGHPICKISSVNFTF